MMGEQAQSVIGAVAKDIVHHFLSRGDQGKAMVGSIDKLTTLPMVEKVRAGWEADYWLLAPATTCSETPQHFLLDDRFNFHIAGILFSMYSESMKTTIDIPDAALADAMRFTGAKTKREAVVKALVEYNRQQLVKEVVASFGTWDIATNDEIEAGDMEEIASGKPKIGIWTLQ